MIDDVDLGDGRSHRGRILGAIDFLRDLAFETLGSHCVIVKGKGDVVIFTPVNCHSCPNPPGLSAPRGWEWGLLYSPMFSLPMPSTEPGAEQLLDKNGGAG